MKLYKEMLRKLAVVGLPLLIVMAAITLIKGVSDCYGAYYILQSTSAISQIEALRYYVFSGVLFALYGFSFLFSRAGSDIYHSLPVKRTNLYLSVFLAAATWMGVTIFISEIEMLLIYLVSGCPFVPVYIPLSFLFYFAASLIVFAATAIGCAVSGTVITALASTGIVLLLPRFVQFMFARGIVERVPIVSWLDFGAMLNPTTNAATGILAMQLRGIYNGHLITFPHILYSLLVAAVMLALGMWLFKRRPSEFAQKSGGYRVWTVLTATLLAFAVMLPVTMNHQKLFSTYGFLLMMAALGVFVVYQLIVSSKFKQALKTLPAFLVAVMAVLAFSGLVNTAANDMLSKTPAVNEIESVTFRGIDEKTGEPSYNTLQFQSIAFTDEETKAYIAQALKDAVDSLQEETDRYAQEYAYNMFQTIEPITIKLVSGGTIKRTIEFKNVDELNTLRMQNESFAEVAKAFPPLSSIQYLRVDSDFTPDEERAILESYIAESENNGLIGNPYFRDRTEGYMSDGSYVQMAGNQSISSMSLTGYVGSKRYSDNYMIQLNVPDTVSLLMRTYNSYAEADQFTALQEGMQRFDDGNALDNDQLGFYVSVYNFENEKGQTVQESVNFYINNYAIGNSYEFDQKQLEYMRAFAKILSRAVLTDRPDDLFIRFRWNFRYEGMVEDGQEFQHPTTYLRFENETDEQEFLSLFNEWLEIQRSY